MSRDEKLGFTEDDQDYAARRLIRAVDEIDVAVSHLELLLNRLNLMDVRHDDFASDADLREHMLNLKAISSALHDATDRSGPLAHFTRGNADG